MPVTVVAVATTMLVLVASVSCQPGGAPRPRPLVDDPQLAHELRGACALAEERCSRCHTLERVVYAEVSSPAEWAARVRSMRRLTGSGISRREGEVIVSCLVYRSFGPAGLAALRDQQKGSP